MIKKNNSSTTEMFKCIPKIDKFNDQNTSIKLASQIKMSANLSIGEMLGIKNLADRQIIRVSSEQLKMFPDISKHILKKRDHKYVGKAAAFGGLITGF